MVQLLGDPKLYKPLGICNDNAEDIGHEEAQLERLFPRCEADTVSVDLGVNLEGLSLQSSTNEVKEIEISEALLETPVMRLLNFPLQLLKKSQLLARLFPPWVDSHVALPPHVFSRPSELYMLLIPTKAMGGYLRSDVLQTATSIQHLRSQYPSRNLTTYFNHSLSRSMTRWELRRGTLC